MLHSDDAKYLQINVRINPAERAMIERLQSAIRPRVSTSRLLIYLAEEEARRRGIIEDQDDGTWLISESVSHQRQARTE